MKFFHALHREIRGLHEAAYLLGLFAVFSQLLALVRDRLLAHSFGAGEALDIYFAAFRIPDLIFAGIASMVSVYVLIPFLSRKLESSRDAAKYFVSSIFTFFLLAVLAASVIAFFLAPIVLPLLFAGFSTAAQDELVLLTRIMLLQPILLGLSGLFASITQTYKKFVLYAVSPLLYNLGIILGVVFLYPMMGLSGLAWGVVAGACLHVAIQLPFIAKTGFLPRITSIAWKNVWEVVRLSLPRTAALFAMQIALLLLLTMASRLAEGSVSIFNLAFNLQFVPLSIIGVSYSVAAFPTLAHLFSRGERDQFFAQITTAARHIIFWSLPIIALFIVLRAQIVRVILGSGSFDWADTRLTAAAVALFIISLAAHGLMLLFVRGYYAAGNTTKPLVINVTSAVLAVVFGYGLLALHGEFGAWQAFIDTILRVDDLAGTAVLMLPLGYALAVLFNAAALLVLFQRDFKEFSSVLSRTAWQSFFAAVVAAVAAYQALAIFADVFDINTFAGIFSQGLLAGISGIVAGAIVLFALGNTEIREVVGALSKRLFKARPVAADQLEP